MRPFSRGVLQYRRVAAALSVAALLLVLMHVQAQQLPSDVVIRNVTVMTHSHGRIENGRVWVHQGKIAGVGESVDPHSHSALGDDINEATIPVILR